MAKLLGKDNILFVHDGTGYLPVACLTTNSLAKTMEMNDGTATKCETAPEPIPGNKTYTIDAEAVNISPEVTKADFEVVDEIYEAGALAYWKIQKEGVDWKFGKGYITDLSLDAPVEGEETFSFTITGSGAMSNTDLKV